MLETEGRQWHYHKERILFVMGDHENQNSIAIAWFHGNA
jgi:succinylglutamate desuccinylase